MKKIAICFILIGAFIAQGCATADKESKALQRISGEQKIMSNHNELRRECLELDKQSKGYAIRVAELNGFSDSEWEKYYQEPSCMKRYRESNGNMESAPIVLPSNLSYTPDEAAKMTNEEMCDNMVRRAVASKTVAAVLNERGEAASYYDDATGYCYFVEKEKTRRRIRWNNLFYRIAPRVGYRYGFGHGNYEYRQSGYYNKTGRYGGSVSGGCEFCGPRRRALIKKASGQ